MRGRLFLLLLANACTSGPYTESSVGDVEQGACVALEGRTFQSIEELECGRTPEGVALCRWQVAFEISTATNSEFAWTYSDVGEAGRAVCNGNSITATSGGGRAITGSFDRATQRLVWAGVAYDLAP